MAARLRKGWFVAAGTLALALSSVVQAATLQEMAREMFDHTSHDFGTVARGAKAEHRFTIENIYVEDLHIESVSSTCGCTKPEVTKRLLKTWEKAQVVARLDTRGHLGRKDATIKVVFGPPFQQTEVQLRVHCFIRGDVVVEPGEVQFGIVPQGVTADQKVKIKYAGRSDWKINRIECANQYLSARASETARGAVTTYDLLVTLKAGAPPGYLNDQLFLVTDDADRQAARVPVPVAAVIRAAGVTAHPSPLWMGAVEAGKTATRQLIVRGNSPFRITRVTSADPRLRATPLEQAGAATTWQRVEVTYSAPAEPGQTSGILQIETDAPGSPPVQVRVDAQVVPAPVKPVPADGSKPQPVKPAAAIEPLPNGPRSGSPGGQREL